MAKKVCSPRSKPEQRHYNMSRIRSNNTKIEVRLRKALWHRGIRYRINYSALPGKPDIALTKYKIAIFCDGELFHGKDWYTVLQPKLQKGSNGAYWEKKIMRNMTRDNNINQQLNFLGWTVIRFWGRDITRHTDECVSVIRDCIFEQTISRSDPLDEFLESENY